MLENGPSKYARMETGRIETLAKFACLYGGLGWGLFWIPLRYMDNIGVSGAWATVAFYVIPAPIVLVMIVWRREQFIKGGMRLHILGISTSFAVVLYSNSMLFTEVVRAMVLYYMTPIWSFLLAWIWLKEAITIARSISILMGISGMLVMFGVDVGIPLPRNLGDWLALAGGLLWAVAAVLMRRDPEHSAIDMCNVFFFWATIFAIAMAFLPFPGPQPEISNVVSNLYWLFPVLVLLVIPTILAVMWGSPLLNPGVVGLLFLSEIAVGTITAALWAGEPFGARELTGVLLVSLAGLTEVVINPILASRDKKS